MVEVAPNAAPPVCRIMNFGKYLYQQSKKAHDAKKKQKVIHVKEIKLRPTIDDHDFEFKANHVKRFLKNGDRVKITVIYRGREVTHPVLGANLIKRLMEAVVEFGEKESEPKLEGRNMTMVLVPKKETKSGAGNAQA